MCPLLEIANNITVFFFVHVLGRVVSLIIILFAYWEVASIIFSGLHDKLRNANSKVIYAILHLFCICFSESECTLFCIQWDVQQNDNIATVSVVLFPPDV